MAHRFLSYSLRSRPVFVFRARRLINTSAGEDISRKDYDALVEKHENLQKEHNELSEKYEDIKDRYTRALAETENVRRRGQRQIEDAKVENLDLIGTSRNYLGVRDTVLLQGYSRSG